MNRNSRFFQHLSPAIFKAGINKYGKISTRRGRFPDDKIKNMFCLLDILIINEASAFYNTGFITCPNKHTLLFICSKGDGYESRVS